MAVDGAPVTAFESDKVRALLAYLAVEAPRPQRRQTLSGLLWPDMPERSARHNLSQVLFNLRQIIGDAEAQPPFLLVQRDTLQFNLGSHHTLDVAQFRALVAACDTHTHPPGACCADCATRLQQAVTLYQGEFLQQFFLADSAAFEEWALLQREHLHRRALTAMTTLTAYYQQEGDYTAARQVCEQQLRFDPWREEAHQQMMRLLALSGQRSAALAQFESCRRILADELGVEPAAETRQLYEQIRQGALDKVTSNKVTSTNPVTLPPLHPVTPAPLQNLPTHLTPFIGRARELAEIKQLLAGADCRLLTLVGPGGMGKTRLALQAAAQQHGVFRHGIAFVPLAGVVGAHLLPAAIADAIGFTFFGSTDLRQQLLNHLRDQQWLLVLDNLEHLLADEQCNATVLAILQQAPGVKLLVTSREPLQVQGEWFYAVDGLGSAAMALFLQSVRRAHAGFVLKDDDQPLIERICRLVGEMPLGIELAATWVRTLSCGEIAEEIERNFDFLSGSARDLPLRHRSLRAVFDQSWALLTAEEQRGLQQAAVFRGGFRREAAAQVAGLPLPRLAALVNKFLLRPGVEGRYDLHEVVRQYAALRLQEDAQAEQQTRTRHALYYLNLLPTWDDALRSSRQQAALAALTADLDNIRQALAWAITNRQIDRLRQVAPTLQHYYEVRNIFREGEATFRQATEMVQTLLQTGAIERNAGEVALGEFQAHWAWFLGRLVLFSPEHRLALLDQSIVWLRQHNERAALADALWFSGVCSWHHGQFARAEQHLIESLALNQILQRPWSAAVVSADLGWVTYHQGRTREAEVILQETLRQGRLLGDPRLIALTVGFLGHTLHSLGRLHEIQALLPEILSLSQATGDRIGMLYALEHLAYEAHRLGNQSEATAHLAAFFALSKEIGNVQGQARVHNALGRQAVHAGEWAQAQSHFMAALQIADRSHLVAQALDALVGVALLRRQEGLHAGALTLAFAVLHHPTCTVAVKQRAERLYAELVPYFTDAQLVALHAQTQAKSLPTLTGELLLPSDALHAADGRSTP